MTQIQNSSSMLDLTTQKRLMLTQQLPGGSTVTTTGATIPTISTVGGSISNVTDTDGSWLDFLTGAANNNNAQVTLGASVNQIALNWLPEITFHMKTGASLANMRWWVGVSTSNMVGGSSTLFDNDSGLAFRFDTGVDTNWQSVSGFNGGASTSVVQDTGITPAINTKYVFRIQTINTGQVNFYINDTLVTTHLTALPAGATIFYPNCGISTLETVAKEMKFSRWVVWVI